MRLFVVLGLGQFGRHTAKTLYANGGDVIAIDADENRVEIIKDEVGQAICMNVTDIDALQSIGVGRADTAIVALGEDDLEASIICCSFLSDMGVGRIIVRAASEEQGRILSRIGASRVIYPEMQMGEQLARSLLATGVIDQVTISTGQIVANVRPRHDMVGKSVGDLKFPQRYRLALIGVQQPKRNIDDRGEVNEELILIPIPHDEQVILEDDILIVVGNQSNIDQVSRRE